MSAATEPSDDLESDLGWSLGVVSKAYQRSGMSAVDKLPGGPRGYHLLRAVSTGQPRSQLALAQRLGVDKTVMTYLLDDLEAARLVKRRPDPADRRARQVVITAKGTQALSRARTQLAAAEASLLVELGHEDAETLRRLISRVARHTRGDTARASDGAVVDCS